MAAIQSPIDTVQVQLGERSYPILIGVDVLDRLPELLAHTGARGAVGIVTDTHVAPLYGQKIESIAIAAGFRPVTISLPPGEQHKRLERIEEITGAFLKGGLDRSSAIVALGGGVVGDVAGFAAGVYMRGLPYIQIPTTVVSQVDSSVGGKTAVNHALAKNVIGAFHQPEGVLIDLALLRSLPDRELRGGLAEVIKHGIIADAALFEYMEQHAAAILSMDLKALHYPVKRSCEIKAEIVAADERELGVRANLNYGHTFGHAIETVSEYGRFIHGEAIAIGMNAAGHLARAMGLADDAFVARQRACLSAYGLPVVWPELPVDAVLTAMKRDKKARAGAMKFIVAEGIGRVAQRLDVTEDQARAALEAVKRAD